MNSSTLFKHWSFLEVEPSRRGSLDWPRRNWSIKSIHLLIRLRRTVVSTRRPITHAVGQRTLRHAFVCGCMILIWLLSTLSTPAQDARAKAAQMRQMAAREQALANGPQGDLHAQAAQRYLNAAAQYDAQAQQASSDGSGAGTRSGNPSFGANTYQNPFNANQQNVNTGLNDRVNNMLKQIEGRKPNRRNDTDSEPDTPDSQRAKQGMSQPESQPVLDPSYNPSRDEAEMEDSYESTSALPAQGSISRDAHSPLGPADPYQPPHRLSQYTDSSAPPDGRPSPNLVEFPSPADTQPNANLVEFPYRSTAASGPLPTAGTPTLSVLAGNLQPAEGREEAPDAGTVERAEMISANTGKDSAADLPPPAPTAGNGITAASYAGADYEAKHQMTVQALTEIQKKYNAADVLESGLKEIQNYKEEGQKHALLSQVGAAAKTVNGVSDMAMEAPAFSGYKPGYEALKAAADGLKPESDKWDKTLDTSKIASSAAKSLAGGAGKLLSGADSVGKLNEAAGTVNDVRKAAKDAQKGEMSGEWLSAVGDGASAYGNKNLSSAANIVSGAVKTLDGAKGVAKGEQLKAEVEANAEAASDALQRRADQYRNEAEELKKYYDSVFFPTQKATPASRTPARGP